MIAPPPCSRRHAIGILIRAVAVLAAGAGAVAVPRRSDGRESYRLSTRAIVALHLDHLARCGPAAARRAAAIAPAALAAAGALHGFERGAAGAAFALLEQFGEFPPTHPPFGGLH